METLKLEFVCEIEVKIGKPFDIGETGYGIRKIIPLLGGTFKGPLIEGIVLPGGADWQLIKENEIADIDARYILQTNEGVLIYLSNKGIRVAAADVLEKLSAGVVVDAEKYYFRTAPVFETSHEKYQWLMKSLFVAKGIRNPENVIIQVWKVL